MLSHAVLRNSRPRLFYCLKNRAPQASHNPRPHPHSPYRTKSPAFRTRQPLRPYSSFQQQKSFWYNVWRSAKLIWLERPFIITLAYATLLFGVPTILYGTYQFLKNGNLIWDPNYLFTSPVDKEYPPAIAKELKQALFYTNTLHNAEKSYEFFKRALQISEQDLGLAPTDISVIRIKSTLIKSMRKLHRPRLAMQILSDMKTDCLDALSRLHHASSSPPPSPEERTRLLRTLATLDGQLGELYASPPLSDADAALRHYLSATELFLSEHTRRSRLGLAPDAEGGWVSAAELSSSLELSADLFERRSAHALAAPLYLRALTLLDGDSRKGCHAAVLMNNLASSLAQTMPGESPDKGGGEGGGPETSRTVLVENAQAWARKALELARGGQMEKEEGEREGECELACAVAMHNLGEFAEMLGEMEEARVRYLEAERMARGLGFEEGRKRAREGLKRLARRTAGVGDG